MQALRQAYADAINKRTDCFFVPTRELTTLLKKLREYHDNKLTEAIESGDKDVILKAIENCTAEEQDMTFSQKLSEAQTKIKMMERKEAREEAAKRERLRKEAKGR